MKDYRTLKTKEQLCMELNNIKVLQSRLNQPKEWSTIFIESTYSLRVDCGKGCRRYTLDIHDGYLRVHPNKRFINILEIITLTFITIIMLLLMCMGGLSLSKVIVLSILWAPIWLGYYYINYKLPDKILNKALSIIL